MIEWKQGEELFADMETVYKHLGQRALSMNHFDLADTTSYTAEQWIEYLGDPRVRDNIKKQQSIVANAAINQLVGTAGDSKSVGQAQLIQAFNKLDVKDSDTKSGPIIIYNYIPPTAMQQQLENVNILPYDPFVDCNASIHDVVTAQVVATFLEHTSYTLENDMLYRYIKEILVEFYSKKD